MEIRRPPDADLSLASFVYACRTDSGVILLDLRRNRYLAITERDDMSLSTSVRGWPPPSVSSATLPTGHLPGSHDIAQTVGKLRESGILDLADREQLLPSIKIDLTQALVSLGDEIRPQVAINLGHVASMVISCLLAAIALRRGKLTEIAQQIRSDRVAQENAGRNFNVDSAAQYVAVFRRLRPYLFTSQDRCLLHAVSLLFFLGRYGVHPTWVFGVRTNPWQAHTWVQEGKYLLDTNPEKVCDFTPILGI